MEATQLVVRQGASPGAWEPHSTPAVVPFWTSPPQRPLEKHPTRPPHNETTLSPCSPLLSLFSSLPSGLSSPGPSQSPASVRGPAPATFPELLERSTVPAPRPLQWPQSAANFNVQIKEGQGPSKEGRFVSIHLAHLRVFSTPHRAGARL